MWGDMQQGRIPVELMTDEKPHYLSVPFNDDTERASSMQLLSRDAATYNDLFDRVLQFYQARCQHHMHKRDRKTGLWFPIPREGEAGRFVIPPRRRCPRPSATTSSAGWSGSTC